MYLIEVYRRRDRPAPASLVDDRLVYGPAYYGELWGDRRPIGKFKCPLPLLEVDGFLRQFCLQQYVTHALEAILVAVLDVAAEERAGVSNEALIRRLTGPPFHAFLKRLLRMKVGAPSTLMRALRERKGVPSEHSLIEAEADCPEEEVARACLLLAALYARWRGESRDDTYLRTRAMARHWAGRLLPDLDQWLEPGTSWVAALSGVIEKDVLQQHDLVFYEKRRLDSCWLRREGDRILRPKAIAPICGKRVTHRWCRCSGIWISSAPRTS